MAFSRDWFWPPKGPADAVLRWAALFAYPEARAALEEILRVRLVKPSIDRRAIEAELGRHLATLDQAGRPMRWFDTFAAAHEYISGKAFEAHERRAAKCVDDGAKEASEANAKSDQWEDAVRAGCSQVWKAANLAAYEAAKEEARPRVDPKQSWDWTGPRGPLVLGDFTGADAKERAMKEVMDFAENPDTNPQQGAARAGAWRRARRVASRTCEDAWAHARMSVLFEHARKVPEAVSSLGVVGRSACAALRRAYAAGLWAFWVCDAEIVAVPAPNLYTDEYGRLYRANGLPTIEWQGDVYWFTERPKHEYRRSIVEMVAGSLLIGLTMLFYGCAACGSLVLRVLSGSFVKRSE